MDIEFGFFDFFHSLGAWEREHKISKDCFDPSATNLAMT